jgi:hypothetical protein
MYYDNDLKNIPHNLPLKEITEETYMITSTIKQKRKFSL